MQLVVSSFETLAENLALDDVLLELAEQSPEPRETVRVWEPSQTLVVIGRSSKHADEVLADACLSRGTPVFRRASGGAAIVAGPGCLMYSVVLSYELRPELRAIDQAHACVLDTLVAGLRPYVPGVMRQGTSDLTLDGQKFSGNSLRCRRSHLLYHGTLLYDFPLDIVAELLGAPPRQPEYRAGRDHRSFVRNLPVDRDTLVRAVIEAWQPRGEAPPPPAAMVEEIVRTRYESAAWNEKL